MKHLPEGMSRAEREAQPISPVPRSLLAVLAVLVLLGVASTASGVQTARNQNAASKADVDRNARLIARVQAFQEAEAASVEGHRVRNEDLHADLCRLVYEVIQAAPDLSDTGIQPCRPEIIPGPVVRPTPTPTGNP